MSEPGKSPLDGIRVLDLTRMAAGPFCAMILGDMGANVTKIEPYPKGDLLRGFGPFDHGEGTYFLSINRNKRSMALDFRSAEARAVLRRLALQADVVVENFKPNVVREIGIDYDSLKEENPRLVYASISGFGAKGPYGGWPGVDQIAQGMSGFMSLTGERGGGPTRVGIPIGDLTAGMWASIGILSALLRRELTGKGSRVETTLVSALIGLLCVQGQRYLSLGEVAGPPGNDHPVIAPYGVYEASDGAFNLCAATTEMWRNLCQIAGREELIEDPDFKDNELRVANLSRLKQELNKGFAKDTCQAWTAKLIAAGIPAGPIYKMDQVFRDQHFQSQGYFEEVAHETIRNLRLVATPIKREGGWREGADRAPPVLGQHSTEILREAGFSDAEVADLLAKKIVHPFTGEEHVRS